MPATIAGSHLGIDTHANRPAANAAGQPIGALYSCSTHGLIYKTDGSSWATYATLGASPTVSENFVTSDVAMTNVDTFYDGPSLSLVAGTYVLMGQVCINNAGTAGHLTAKLWDGASAVYDSPEQYALTTGGEFMLSVFGTVVLGSTTTVKISASRHGAGGSPAILATGGQAGTTNKASHLVALKIA